MSKWVCRIRRHALTASALSLMCLGVAAGPVAALPDGRSYELVSAPDKNGGDVLIDTARVRVGADGGAVEYSSLTGFGDAIGGGVATEYMSVRAPGGWATHAITPPQQALSFQAVAGGLEPRYEGDLSSDLSVGVVRAWRPLTDEDANIANVSNLYLREDLRTPGSGGYRLLSACPVCVVAFPTELLNRRPTFIDATADYGKLLFESELNLTPGASGGAFKLYEWDHGTVELVGILPDGTPAAEAGAGSGTVSSGATYTHHALSADGSKVFFTAVLGGVRNVYMRLDGTTTVQLNASETSPTTAESAHYWDASVSGSRVFFTSPQSLTDDAPREGGSKLYMYDTTKPDSDPHNLTYLSADNEPSDPASNVILGVVGASADGRTVYFYGTSQLVPGAPAPSGGGQPLFMWHEGDPLAFVHMLTIDDESRITFDASPALGGKTSSVTPSGDLLYLSNEPIGPDNQDHGSCPLNFTHACYEAYVYKAATHELRCASCSPDGAPATGDAQLMLQGSSVGASTRPAHMNRAISDDGRRVFFTTLSALVPEDVNGKADAYEYDVPSGTVSLLSSGRDPSNSYFMEASPSGDDAVFVTRAQLVGWDRDQNYDLYDARVGGGFPEPPPTPPACAGDACKGALTTTPGTEPGASSVFTGTGDARARLRSRSKVKRCRRGTVRQRTKGHRGHVRCVKKHRARKAVRRAAARRNR
jgi:hypothetical protein